MLPNTNSKEKQTKYVSVGTQWTTYRLNVKVSEKIRNGLVDKTLQVKAVTAMLNVCPVCKLNSENSSFKD